MIDLTFTSDEQPKMSAFNYRFSTLNQLYQYWWKRRTVSGEQAQVPQPESSLTTITLRTRTYDYDGTPTGQSTVYVSDAVQAIDGEVVQVSPTSQSAAYNGYGNYSELSASLRGKYIKSSVSGYSNNVYLIPETGTVQENIEVVDSYRKRFTLTIDGYLVTVQTITITETGPWEYIQSSNRNAYPDSGIQDGYEYQFLGRPLDNAVDAPKIETGSYVGTGTYGSGNPNTLTLPFVPKTIEFIGAEGGTYNNYQGTDPYPVIVAADYLTDEYQYVVIYDSGKANDFQYMKLDGTTLSWYYGKSAAGQLNTSGHKYYYKITG